MTTLNSPKTNPSSAPPPNRTQLQPGGLHSTFDMSLFSFDPSAQTPVSQPRLPIFENSLSVKQRPMSGLSPSSCYLMTSGTIGSTPESNSHYDPSSPYLNRLDQWGSSSPPAGDTMSGISGNNTPGFDTLDDLPDLCDDPLDNLTGEFAESSKYLPSPRLTVSPAPVHGSVEVTLDIHSIDFIQSDIIVKVDQASVDTNMQDISEGHLDQQQISTSGSGLQEESTAIRREDDGSWRGGIDPLARGSEYLPLSIKQQEFEEQKRKKNILVEEWIERSLEQLPCQTSKGGLVVPSTVRRRTKSMSDFRARQPFPDRIPDDPSGSCQTDEVVVTNDGDDCDDDSSSVESGWREGSLDDSLDEKLINETPLTPEELKKAEAAAERQREQRERETDPAFLPKPKQFFSAHPWNDIVGSVTRGASMAVRNQPISSKAAMIKFQKCTDNIETASRVATFGSHRRNSAGDIDKALMGPLKRLSLGRDKDKDRAKEKERDTDRDKEGPLSRRSSILGVFRSGLKRSLSNSGDRDKEKKSNKLQSPQVSGRKRGNTISSNSHSSSSTHSRLGAPFGNRNPSLKIDTNIGNAFAQMASPLMAAGAGQNSHKPTSPTAKSSFGDGIISRVRRSRSRSDLQRKHIFGVVTSLVGPALPSALSPEEDLTPGRIAKRFTFGEESRKRGLLEARNLLSPRDAHRNDDKVDLDDGEISPGSTKMPLPKHSVAQTLEGFAENIRMLTPGLCPKLVDRVANEQCKRYKKLVEYRQKHLALLKQNSTCSNGLKCRQVIGAIGVSSECIVSVASYKRGGGGGSFNYDENNSAFEAGDAASPRDGNVVAAPFPPGVPSPPVPRLPAEFECPICFKVKKINKPSDWTKHVHEDVQPFTCTYPDCTEPKSFKRKADWVRHENERHRHLEWWKCNQLDCTHTCYRKDNFVQHLVREHKMPEPKLKSLKGKNGANDAGDGLSRVETNKVWHIVDACHTETKKLPNSEKCRFCGATCSSWKKLTVHLARHMEAISLPILDLIRDDSVLPPVGAKRTATQRVAPTLKLQTSSQLQPSSSNRNEADRFQTPQQSPDRDHHMSKAVPNSGPPPRQSVPIYTLTPPQQSHHRSYSASNLEMCNNLSPSYIHQQHPSIEISPTITPCGEALSYGDDYHFSQQQDTIHHKSPGATSSPTQVFIHQTGGHIESAYSLSGYYENQSQGSSGTNYVAPSEPLQAAPLLSMQQGLLDGSGLMTADHHHGVGEDMDMDMDMDMNMGARLNYEDPFAPSTEDGYHRHSSSEILDPYV